MYVKNSRKICDAIRDLHLLGYVVVKDGVGLIVEPHCCGISVDSHPVLWAWCVSAMGSASSAAGAWQLCRLDEMREVHILAEKFTGPRPGYRRSNKQIPKIFCQL